MATIDGTNFVKVNSTTFYGIIFRKFKFNIILRNSFHKIKFAAFYEISFVKLNSTVFSKTKFVEKIDNIYETTLVNKNKNNLSIFGKSNKIVQNDHWKWRAITGLVHLQFGKLRTLPHDTMTLMLLLPHPIHSSSSHCSLLLTLFQCLRRVLFIQKMYSGFMNFSHFE